MIRISQNGGGGPPSTMVPPFSVLNVATQRAHVINATSPSSTIFVADKSFI